MNQIFAVGAVIVILAFALGWVQIPADIYIGGARYHSCVMDNDESCTISGVGLFADATHSMNIVVERQDNPAIEPPEDATHCTLTGVDENGVSVSGTTQALYVTPDTHTYLTCVFFAHQFGMSSVGFDTGSTKTITFTQGEPPDESCVGVVCDTYTDTCPDGFVATCVGSCYDGECFACTPNCVGHDLPKPANIFEAIIQSIQGFFSWLGSLFGFV